MIATLAALLALATSGGPSAPAADVGLRLGDRQLAGQRLVTGFSGPEPPATLVRMIERGRVAGVILFSGNFSSEAEAQRLISDLNGIPRPDGLRQPLLVAVDQEGGLVKRLPGPPLISAASIGAAGSEEAARQGRATGEYLRGLGFNLDLAPVLDLAVPGGEIERTGRGFSATPSGVIRNGIAFAEGLEEGGVASAAKHFPGFGRAIANTDNASQTITAGRDELAVDEQPFRAYARGGDVIMLANAVYPALDPARPAGLSRAIATRELRRAAGFDGVSITDSLNAAAITALGSPEDIARMGARAGTDLLLFTSLDSAAAAGKTLARDLRAGRLNRERFEASVERVRVLRASLRN